MKARFARFATLASEAAGHWLAFTLALLAIIAWAIAGLFVGYGDTLFQLAINTGTTIVTFIMVFILQNTQNRDAKAMHLKLDDLIRAVDAANNRLIGAEEQPEERIAREKAAEIAAREQQ